MREYLRDTYKIKSVWHFTHSKNLVHIRNSDGLLPSSQLEEKIRKNEIITGGHPGARRRERQLGLHNYIHLCFYPEHPMEWRIIHDPYRNPQIREEDVRWLEIDTKVLDLEGVRYTFNMANTENEQRLECEQAITLLRLDYIFPPINNYRHQNILFENPRIRNTALKHEILVPHKIELKYIKNFYVEWRKNYG